MAVTAAPAGGASEQRELGRGLLWLGSSNVLSKLVDALSAIFVLRFLSREELGLATLAWATTTLVETFNALGVGGAVIQAPVLSESAKNTAFWYAVSSSALLGSGVFAAAPFVAGFYELPALLPLIQVSSLKLLLVGAANVPLAMASRGLLFERLGVITTLSTLLASGTTAALAALGWGAWAPLIGNTAHGAFQLLGVCWLAPMRLGRGLSWAEVKPLARTGWALAGAGAAGQVARNLDYWILGRIGGAAALGSYRVAFELAMLPAFTALQVASRSSLPVYSRLVSTPERLGAALSWTASTASVVLLAPLLLVFLEGDAVFAAIGKVSDPSLQLATRALCIAALLRAVAQLSLPALIAAGLSRLVLLEALVSSLMLAASFAASVTLLGGSDARAQVAYGWLLGCSLLVPFELWLVRRLGPGVGLELVTGLRGPLLLGLGVGVICWLLQQLSPLAPGLLRLALHGAGIIALYLLAVRSGLGLRLSDLRRAPGDRAT